LGNGLDYLVARKVFSLGNGLYVVPLLLPGQVEPGSQIKLHQVVVNLNHPRSNAAKCKLEVTGRGFEIPAEEGPKLEFSLASGKVLYCAIALRVPADTKPGEYPMKVIGKTSYASQAASAVVTAAFTIGLAALLGGGMVGSSWNQGEGYTSRLRVVRGSKT